LGGKKGVRREVDIKVEAEVEFKIKDKRKKIKVKNSTLCTLQLKDFKIVKK